MQQRVSAVLETAAAHEEAGRLEAAIAALEEGWQQYSSGEIRREMLRLKNQRQQQRALARAREADQAGELDAAISAWERVQELGAHDQAETRLNTLRAERAFRQARDREQAGDLDAARQKYRQAVSLADHEAARAALARIEESSQFDTRVNAGDQAMRSDNFAAAIDHYEEALQIQDAPRVQAKLEAARIERRLVEAQTALDRRNLRAARAAFADVLEMDQDNRRAAGGLEEVRQWEKYQDHLERGDAFRKQSRFGIAKLQYSRAMDIFRTEEIQQRIEDIEFESLIAAAKRDMEAENWQSARGWLQTALAERDTQQVRQLLEEVHEHAPPPDAE